MPTSKEMIEHANKIGLEMKKRGLRFSNMNEYQTAVNDIYDAKLKKYRLHPEMLTDELHNELYGEAIREAQMQCATFLGVRS